MTATRYLLLAASTLLSHVAAAQRLITGKVLDKQTRQPVPYASVVVAGTTQGTTTNAEGEFGLRVAQLPAKVLAFSLGYGRDSVTVTAAGPTPALALQAAPVQLPAVEPTSYAAQLLARAYRVLQRTRGHSEYGQAFYRQFTRNGDQPIEALEAVWDVKTNSAGLAGTRLSQGRYATHAGLMNFTNFSLYTKIFGGFCGLAANDMTNSHAVLGPDATRLYTLRYQGQTQSSGRRVAEVAFVSRPGIPWVSGSLYIDLATYQVLHARATRPMDFKSSRSKGFVFKADTISLEADFKPQLTGAVPNYVRVTAALVVGQPRKPDVPVGAASFTSFYDGRPTPTGLPYAGPEAIANDLAAIKQKPYGPDFWRDNPVVKRTPLEEETIKSFEQSKAFGTILTR